MKRLLTYFTILVLGVTNAQVLIDDTTTPNNAPDPSAVLELRSDDKGLLVPRLATNPTGTPVEGLVYYDNVLKCFKGYNGTSWEVIGADCLFANYILSIANPSPVQEGNPQTFTVTLTPEVLTGHTVTVDYATNDGSATSGSDYTAVNGTLTFLPGESSKIITVNTTSDSDTEGNEDYTITLSNEQLSGPGSTITIGTPTATAVITEQCSNNILAFGFDGNAGNEASETPDDKDANITSAVITRGAGLDPDVNPDSFRATSGNATTVAEAVSLDEYFEVTVNVANGYKAIFTAFDFNWKRSDGGATAVELRSSLDGYTTALGTMTGLDDSVNNVINFNAIEATGTITFRLYVWGATDPTETFGFEGDGRDVTFLGCVNVAPSACNKTDLIISEYVEGSGNNRYIEIYNGTGSTVDLTAYTLTKYVNGGSQTSSASLLGNLDDGDAIVFKHPSANEYTGPTTTLAQAVMDFNGNDPIELRKGSTRVDIIGTVGNNDNFGENKTLSRSATAQPKTAYIPTEWAESPQNDVSGLGYYTCSGGAGTPSPIIISEIGDPNNDPDARFIELYNLGTTAVNISGYTLIRWTNDNYDQGNTITIPTSTTLAAGESYVIVADEEDFEDRFGENVADLEGGSGSGPANSNGDDNIGLFDNYGNLLDFFGVVGEDGSGTCHEFEDGRALRIPGMTSGATTWDESQWNVWADSTVNGCTSHTNDPQNAPNDFTPGSHTN